MSTTPSPITSVVDSATISKLLTDVAALSNDVQSVKQASQQVNQSIADFLNKMGQQTSTQNVAGQVLQEETLGGEQFQASVAGKTARLANTDANDAGILFLNQKALADDTQLSRLRFGQDLYTAQIGQLLEDFKHINAAKLQHAQNAISAAKQLDAAFAETYQTSHKQYLEHSHLAHDSFWNPVSAGAGANLMAGAAPAVRMTDTAGAVATGAITADMSAIVSAVAKSFDATITPVMAVLQQVVALLTAQNAAKA